MLAYWLRELRKGEGKCAAAAVRINVSIVDSRHAKRDVRLGSLTILRHLLMQD